MIQSNFSRIQEICPNNPESWSGKLFLSFDIDWAHDEVILDCYDLVSKYSAESTWFVTHQTDLLDVFISDKKVELGLHPNFNDLLSGKPGSTPANSSKIIQKSKELVPTATTVRSHSLTQNERLIDQFLENDLKRICNLFIPYRSNMRVLPYYMWSDAIIIPHRFQDNASLRLNEGVPKKDILTTGLHVFDFHPIHVFLNTESLDRYERTRPLHYNPKELIKHRYHGYGTRNRLIELLQLGTCL